jgi:hypothetical protein
MLGPVQTNRVHFREGVQISRLFESLSSAVSPAIGSARRPVQPRTTGASRFWLLSVVPSYFSIGQPFAEAAIGCHRRYRFPEISGQRAAGDFFEKATNISAESSAGSSGSTWSVMPSLAASAMPECSRRSDSRPSQPKGLANLLLLDGLLDEKDLENRAAVERAYEAFTEGLCTDEAVGTKEKANLQAEAARPSSRQATRLGLSIT